MKIKNILSFLFIILLITSCKTKMIKVKESTCETIKTKDSIIYVNDSDNLLKEINSYQGLIKLELESFYESKYDYDYMSYEYLEDKKIWLYNRLYFDDKIKKWVHIQQEKKREINEDLNNGITNEFESLIEGGYLIKDGSNSGFFKTYLINKKGVLKTEVVKISQTCSLSNTKLNSLSIIESKLSKSKW